MSTTNHGKRLQNLIAEIAAIYANRGILYLQKVDPPMRVFGSGNRRKVIFLPNPWLDFHGVWKVRSGRSVALEAKETAKPTLSLAQSGGVSESQVAALGQHAAYGAAVGVLWLYADEMRFVPHEAITAQLRNGRKSIKWEQATPIPKDGMLSILEPLWDFERVLGEYHPTENKH